MFCQNHIIFFNFSDGSDKLWRKWIILVILKRFDSAKIITYIGMALPKKYNFASSIHFNNIFL